nr:M23 family metallopeptidase [Leifsonia xyli]
MDFAAPLGTPVRSVYGGVVISTQPSDLGGCGLSVEVAHEFHGHSIVTRYCHLDTLAVQPGQQLSGGETLGTLGSSCVSTGPHLHFELMVDGTHVDPQDWLGNNTKGWL